MGGRRKGLVLVIDDEPSIRDLLRVILEMDGFSVETACNGKEALEKLAKIRRPCMILLDMMMPVMNGWQFYSAKQADARFRDIPTVIVTAYSRHEIEMPPLETLGKPIDFPVLRELSVKYCREAGSCAL